MKLKLICYWVLTIIATVELLVGAECDLTHRPDVVQLVTHLGHPTYVLTILGFWKLLAVIGSGRRTASYVWRWNHMSGTPARRTRGVN
jgi:hypothetical protein